MRFLMRFCLELLFHICLASTFFVGAAIVGLLAALGIGFINRNSIVKNDAAIGIVFSLFFAVGVLMIAKAKTAIDLTQILFGNVLTVSDTDRTMTLIIGGLVLLLVFVFYKELVLTSFDPVMAEASGMKVGLIHYLLMLMLTLVTVVSLQTVGVILVVSLLITPASTAYLLTHRMSTMIFLSAAIGAISAIVGLFFSFSFNLSSGPSIVVVATAIFILAFVFAPRRGLIAKYL